MVTPSIAMIVGEAKKELNRSPIIPPMACSAKRSNASSTWNRTFTVICQNHDADPGYQNLHFVAKLHKTPETMPTMTDAHGCR